MPPSPVFAEPSPEAIAAFGKIAIARGRNTWRLALTSEIPTRQRALEASARLMVKLLSRWQPLAFFHPYPGARSPYAIAFGDARPIEPVEAKRGGVSAAMGVPTGELLGIRSISLPAPEGVTPQAISVSMPKGGYPCWWVLVDFWWRGDPIPSSPMLLTGRDAEHFGVLDVAVKPTVENDPGAKSADDLLGEYGAAWWTQTIEDWDKAMPAARKAGIGIVAGGALLLLGMAFLRGSK